MDGLNTNMPQVGTPPPRKEHVNVWNSLGHPDFRFILFSSYKCASSALGAALLSYTHPVTGQVMSTAEDGFPEHWEELYNGDEKLRQWVRSVRQGITKQLAYELSAEHEVRYYARHPVDRLMSALRYFSKGATAKSGYVALKGARCEYDISNPDHLASAFEDFVRYAIYNPDPHWSAQWRSCCLKPGDDSTFIPNSLRTFRFVGEVADRVGAERRNSSLKLKPWRIALTPTAEKMVREHWGDDWDMWDEACIQDKYRTGSARIDTSEPFDRHSGV